MFDILVNPISGKGKSLVALKTVETILTGKEVEYEVHKTMHPFHATEIVKELNKKDDCKLIVMGGDGTFNEALNGIEDFSKITVGFIPCGTGNDYVKATNIPKDVQKALELILNGEVGYTDFIQLDDGKRALNTAGAGMDVDVLVRYYSMKAFSGKMRYFAALIDTVIHTKFHKMILELDGVKYDKSVFLISIANGRFIGGGLPISPKSDVNDGLFDIVIVNEIKKRKILPTLIKFLRAKHLELPCTEHIRAKEVTVTLLDDGKTQVDGEIYENQVLHCVLMHDTLKTYK